MNEQGRGVGHRHRVIAGLAVMIGNLSCGQDIVDSLGPAGSPRLSVMPNPVLVNSVELNRTRGRMLQLENIGDAPLTIQQVAPQIFGPFVVASLETPLTLEPAQAALLRIDDNPAGLVSEISPFRYSLVITSNDPTEPEKVVVFELRPSAPTSLLALPEQLRFGRQLACAPTTRTVTLHNTHDIPMALEAISVGGPDAGAFHLASPLIASSIAPGESLEFQVIFQAPKPGDFEATVRVQARLQQRLVSTRIPLTGHIADGPLVEENFQRAGPPKEDILFVVDDTPSMSQEWPNVLRNVAAMAHRLFLFDYQVGVTTTAVGAGRSSGRLLPPSSPHRVVRSGDDNPIDRLLGNLAAVTSTTPTANQGLEASVLALQSADNGPLNPGFLRDDASLWIVVISDRDDESSRTLDALVDALLTIKGTQFRTRIGLSAIVGPEGGCNSAFGQADAAPRYAEVAQRTAGVSSSICEQHWPTVLGYPQTTFPTDHRFFLSKQPASETITIEMEGVDLPREAGGRANWSYDIATNSINFTPFAVPEPSAKFVVRFAEECVR